MQIWVTPQGGLGVDESTSAGPAGVLDTGPVLSSSVLPGFPGLIWECLLEFNGMFHWFELSWSVSTQTLGSSYRNLHPLEGPAVT